MKVTKLTIKNVGLIANETIPFNKPLILFYGEIRQGKTTILNAVRWVCGGTFPQDIIRHGEKEASVELEFDGGLIARSWYRAKDGATAARPVTFIKNGKPVQSPVNEIKRLLNPFLLDQDHLRKMEETERRKYFCELFAVDTTALDKEAFECAREAQQLRATIKGYGEIKLEKVDERVDIDSLRHKLATAKGKHGQRLYDWQKQIDDDADAYRKHEQQTDRLNAEATLHNNKVQEKRERLSALRKEIAELEEWLIANPTKRYVPMAGAKPELAPMPVEPPEISELQSQIEAAGEINFRFEQYRKDLARFNQRAAEEKMLEANEKRQREIKAEKISNLKEISNSSGIADLEFDEEGNFTYQGTQAGMLSTSQIMRLSSELSALYPDGFGLDLIDRAESLGKSIFDFVEKAKREDKTILATIVGERPAAAPPEVGVFVVANGHIT